MSRAVRLDFVASRTWLTWTGAAALALGACAIGAVAWDLQGLVEHRAALAAELEARTRATRPVAATPADDRAARDLDAMRRELELPWSQLLADLESASHDAEREVALLEIEPDADKRVVHVKAESRSLATALQYLDRLQASRTLHYPALDSHEVSKDDPEHPVRVQLTAEWRP